MVQIKNEISNGNNWFKLKMRKMKQAMVHNKVAIMKEAMVIIKQISNGAK